jgi:hypothetical protein
MPQPLLGVNALYIPQSDRVFICGGASDSAVPSSICRLYNISNNTYEAAAPLPRARWSGKLVRVRDSLYLIGSIDSSFQNPDGLIFKYSINQNTWVIKDTMPQPYLLECAAAVINDSLIVTIGGSTSGFTGAANIVRVYNPWMNRWKTSSTPYPVNNSTAHAESIFLDSAYHIIVTGGYGAGMLKQVYNGTVTLRSQDTVSINWVLMDSLNTPFFGQPVYRVGGARAGDFLLFGPAMNVGVSINQIWALKLINGADHIWYRLDPKSIDTAAMVPTYGVKTAGDTNYLFLFGGYRQGIAVSSAQKYTYGTPVIGISNISQEIPAEFSLGQNYPNPFNPTTNFEFRIADFGLVNLTIYDALGRKVETVVNQNLKPGIYSASWNAAGLASGVYFYRITAGGFHDTKKMIFVK